MWRVTLDMSAIQTVEQLQALIKDSLAFDERYDGSADSVYAILTDRGAVAQMLVFITNAALLPEAVVPALQSFTEALSRVSAALGSVFYLVM